MQYVPLNKGHQTTTNINETGLNRYVFPLENEKLLRGCKLTVPNFKAGNNDNNSDDGFELW